MPSLGSCAQTLLRQTKKGKHLTDTVLNTRVHQRHRGAIKVQELQAVACPAAHMPVQLDIGSKMLSTSSADRLPSCFLHTAITLEGVDHPGTPAHQSRGAKGTALNRIGRIDDDGMKP